MEITLGNGITKATAVLSKSQDTSNCVPFVTGMLSETNDDWDKNLADIYFESGPKVVAERSLAGGTVYLGIFIVEFDSSKVNVQQGAISFSGTSDTDSITSVDQSKAALVFYYRVPSGDDDWNHVCVAGWFSADNTLSWQRDADPGSIEGHYYVFEAVGTEFSVQAKSFSIPNGQTVGTISITEVNPDKTFLVASHRASRNDDGCKESAMSIYLNTATEVKAERYKIDYSIPDIRVFVIEFSGVETVQRGTFSYANLDVQKQATLSTAVDTGRAMAWNPNMRQGNMMTNTGAGNYIECAFQRLKIIEGGTKIQGDRGYGEGTDGQQAIGKWEVVEWALNTKASFKTHLRTHNTNYEGDEHSPTDTSWHEYSTFYTTNPYTGTAWTWSEIDAMEIGLSIKDVGDLDGYRGRCTQVWVEVYYTS